MISVAVKIAVGISIEIVAVGIPVEVVAVGVPEIVAVGISVEIVSVVYRHVSAHLSSNIAPTTSLSIE